jgi:hypothetical protein
VAYHQAPGARTLASPDDANRVSVSESERSRQPCHQPHTHRSDRSVRSGESPVHAWSSPRWPRCACSALRPARTRASERRRRAFMASSWGTEVARRDSPFPCMRAAPMAGVPALRVQRHPIHPVGMRQLWPVGPDRVQLTTAAAPAATARRRRPSQYPMLRQGAPRWRGPGPRADLGRPSAGSSPRGTSWRSLKELRRAPGRVRSASCCAGRDCIGRL